MIQTKWIALTGGPSSGITSLGNYLRLCGLPVIPECSRAIIDVGRSLGLSTQDVRENQILHERRILALQADIEASLDPHELVVIERGILDPVAYGISQEECETYHKFQYQKVFVLERVGFEQDYARTEDEEEALRLDRDIRQAYLDGGYNLHDLKKASMMERCREVLEILGHKKDTPLNPLCEKLFHQTFAQENS